MPNLTIKDLEKLTTEHPDHQMELVGGKIIIMSPSGLESDEVAAMIINLLLNWVRPRKLGRVTASSAGFRLPNADGDIRAPDAAFIQGDRLPQTTENYAEIVPDLIFEVKSKTDSVTKLQEKIQQFLMRPDRSDLYFHLPFFSQGLLQYYLKNILAHKNSLFLFCWHY